MENQKKFGDKISEITQTFFRNFIAKIAYSIIIISPFIFRGFWDINLFDNNTFIAVYIIASILLSINTLTNFNVKVAGFEITISNTGASIEILGNLKEKSFKVQLHGGTDEEKVKRLTEYIRKLF